LEIRFTPTAEDSVNALRATSQPAWVMLLFVLLLALMFLVGIYLVDHDLAVIGWIWLAASAGLGITVYQVPLRQARRALQSNPSAQGEVVLTLDDNGTAATFPTGKSQLEWRAYTKYKETDHLFLMTTGTRSSIIPKRVMSAEQVRELRALLNVKIRKQL
jgi:YcxB-like protein